MAKRQSYNRENYWITDKTADQPTARIRSQLRQSDRHTLRQGQQINTLRLSASRPVTSHRPLSYIDTAESIGNSGANQRRDYLAFAEGRYFVYPHRNQRHVTGFIMILLVYTSFFGVLFGAWLYINLHCQT